MSKILPTPKARKRKKTGGGKATNAGVPFQGQTLAWIAVHALARKPLRRIFGGAADPVPVLLKHETGSGVDDAVIQLDPKGRLHLQVTTAPSPKKVADFLEQAAETWLESMTGGAQGEFTPRLDKAHDALVLVVPTDAPKRLDDLHDACRQFDEATLWPDAGVDSLNEKQREALELARNIFAKAYTKAKGNPPSNDDLVEPIAMVRVARVDVANGGGDQNDALNMLRQNVLGDPNRAKDAWNLLVINSLEAMKRARGARREGLADTLIGEGFELRQSEGTGRTSVQIVSDAVARNTQALEDLKAVVRPPREDEILGRYVETELTSLLMRARQRTSFVEPAVYRKDINDLAWRCIKGDLVKAPAALRFRTVIFAARSNGSDKETEQRGRELLAEASKVDPTGSTKLAEATLLGLSDVDAAMKACRQLDAPEARSQLFVFLRNAKGNQAAHDWVKALSPEDFNAVGAVNVAGNALLLGHFEFAAEWVEKAPQPLLDESPGLQFVRGQIRLASTVPADHRPSVLQGLPRHLGTVTFAQTPAALAKRSQALADFKAVEKRLSGLDVPDVEAVVAELILWLELSDPSTHQAAKERLAADLRSPKLVVERARLGISFGVDFDRKGLQAELLRLRNTGGWTGLEASTALLLQMASNDYAKVAAFIEEHRKELERARSISPGEITGIEIEALARSGALAKARARLEQAGKDLPEEMSQMLATVLAECSGHEDEAEIAKRNFDRGQGTDELRLYCGALARKGDYATLAESATELARRTLNADDLARALNVLRRVGRWRAALSLLDDLSDVGSDDDRVRLAKAEALFRTGNVNGARAILDQSFKESSDSEVLQLDILVSVESGDWGHVQGIIDRMRGATEKFTPIHLARLARLARDAGSSHAQELMDEALKRAGDDPHIYLAAYTLAMERGEEGEEKVHEWFRKADELSGENGPIQRKSIKDIAEMAPGWREREERVNNEVRSGNAPLFVAARTLNLTVTNASLGRGLNNLAAADATRRSPILAFDGSRRPVNLSNVETLALDLSGLLTLGLLGLAPKVLDAFRKVIIGAGTLTLLFEERERIRFHQPSRVAKAKRLKELMDKGAIKVLEPPSTLPRELVKEVGEELAGFLVKARELGGLVVQPGPLHKVGTFMETDAEIGDYTAEVTDTRQVLAFLKTRGALTANVEKDAMTYIHRVDKGMPGAKAVTGTVPLFLDDLAISYLEHTETLKPLTQAVGSVTVSRRIASEVEALLTYEQQAGVLLQRVDGLRAALAAGIRKGNVIINERKPSSDDDDDDIRQSPTMALLQSVTPYQAILVDDKALNRLAHWDVPAGRAVTATTLDLLDALVERNRLEATDKAEAQRVLRVANFQLIGTSEEELVGMVREASIDADDIIESQEMIALRENLLSVAASRGLQPREEYWLLAARFAAFRAIRRLWVEMPDTAAVKGAWLLSILPSPADFCPLPLAPEVWAKVRELEAAETALFLNGISVAEPHREAYNEWVTVNILEPLMVDDPDRFERAIAYYKKVVKEVANGRLN